MLSDFMVEDNTKPKIVLVWGVHPSESAITEYLSTILKPLLEARGFEVKIIQYPQEFTINNLVKRPKFNKLNEFGEYEMVTGERIFTRIERNNPDATIIDLHTTNETRIQSLFKIRKPKFWSVNYANDFRKGRPTAFLKAADYFDLENYYVFEMPAKFKPARQEWLEWVGKTDYDKYFAQEADLNATKRMGWLSPRLIAKIVHFIDFHIKSETIYSEPRLEPNKPKANENVAIRIEQQRKQKQEQRLKLLRTLRERMRPR